MSKKRRFQRQSATNPAQIRASRLTRHIPVILESGDGQRETVLVSEMEMKKIQREYNRATTVKAEAEDGTPSTLTVGGAGTIYAESGK